MQLTFSRILPASPAEVWGNLLSASRLARTIPGCQNVEIISPGEIYRLRIFGKLGVFDGQFYVTLHFENFSRPERYSVRFDIESDFGHGSGTAQVTLDPIGTGIQTEVGLTLNGEVDGRLARVGIPLLETVIRRMLREMFDKLQAYIVSGGLGVPEPPPPPLISKRRLAFILGTLATFISTTIAAVAIYRKARQYRIRIERINNYQ